MQIQLKQQHVEAAIRDFIAKAGITFDVDEINFTAGRGKDGLTATVDLEDPFAVMLDEASEAPVEKAPAAQPKPEAKEAKQEVAKPEPQPEPEPEEPAEEPQAEEEPVEEPAKEEAPAAKAPPFSIEEEDKPETAEAPPAKKVSLFG